MTSDDPVRPTLELHLSGTVRTEITSEPEKFDLGSLLMGKGTEMGFSLKVSRPDRVRITEVEAPDNAFSVVSLGDGKGDVSRYKLVFEGRNQPGPLSSVVLVHYENPDKNTKRIRVQATVESAIDFPRLVRFTKIDDDFPPQTIPITARNGQPVRITDVQDRGRSLEFEYDEEAGVVVNILARVADTTKSYVRMKRGTLVVTTSEPLESTFEITYMISQSPR